MVKIGVGTFQTTPSYNSYYLYMDTGSDLIWLQCEGCRARNGRCFSQREPLFANSRSQSYLSLPCNKSQLCIPNHCIGSSCSYNISYKGSTSSSGILAQESFAFISSNREAQRVTGLVFGCGIANEVTYGDDSNQIAGIMGLGWGKLSFVSQIDSQSDGKFSYCLLVVNKYTHRWPETYLRFGSDTVIRPNLRMTPLKHHEQRKSYLLELQGISVNRVRLNINASVFSLRRDGTGGCIIDTGTPFSRIVSPAYAVLRKSLENYFSRLRNLKYSTHRGLDLCYKRKKAEGFKKLPTITFHLRNGDLVVGAKGSFLVTDKIGLSKGEYFCLAMVPNDSGSVIGAYQQTNQRFVYDTKGLKLFFGPEDCSRDARENLYPVQNAMLTFPVFYVNM
ncbi:aspartyl protease family protein 2-like [Actinidia eriantha]|uniref:aspartyl protease family protein 2-like n=1 Tax=Actinidia eriantha TaxID=165200 RepID=UPI00258A3801|nr:aspartyl protease family protein 2-like [Actinidia eriantha]